MTEVLRQTLQALPRAGQVVPVGTTPAPAARPVQEKTERLDVTQGKLSMGWRVGTNAASAMMRFCMFFPSFRAIETNAVTSSARTPARMPKNAYLTAAANGEIKK